MPPIFSAIRKRKVGRDTWSPAVFPVRFLSCKTQGLEKAEKFQESLGERMGLFTKAWVNGNLL